MTSTRPRASRHPPGSKKISYANSRSGRNLYYSLKCSPKSAATTLNKRDKTMKNKKVESSLKKIKPQKHCFHVKIIKNSVVLKIVS